MQIGKVLARKDGLSVIVAVIVGLLTFNVISSITVVFSNRLILSSDSSLNGGNFSFSENWKQDYLMPVLAFLFGILLLEILLQMWFYATQSQRKTTRKK